MLWIWSIIVAAVLWFALGLLGVESTEIALTVAVITAVAVVIDVVLIPLFNRLISRVSRFIYDFQDLFG